MKLQHLAVIFIIIILPISITMSNYLKSQIDEISRQNSYDKKLQDATYDMVKAFQINTVNNKFSTISDSKIRDIEAAVNTFYNTLGANLGASGYDKNTLRNYTPALLFNLYDGYYIYSTYDNAGDGKQNNSNATGGTVNTGLKPYIYYSARYNDGSTNIVVNYTLDNYVTIMGNIDGGTDYVTKSGYLIDPESVKVTNASGTEVATAVLANNYKFDGSNIDEYRVYLDEEEVQEEKLSEFLVVLDNSGNIATAKNYNYMQLNSQKIYWDENDPGKYYYYNKYQLSQISDASTISQINASSGFSTSAKKYYIEAKIFSEWVNTNLSDIQISHIQNIDPNDLKYTAGGTDTRIFALNSGDNNPMDTDALFNEHRRAIIRKSIEDNLSVVMTNFSKDTVNTYEYMMPEISEIDWGKIVDNISVTTFLQGIPMKYKFYNNYCTVTNNKNQEVVENNSIYIVDGSGTYHKPGCTELFDKCNDDPTLKLIGYSNIDFLRQTAKQTESSTPYYFYPQGNSGAGVTQINGGGSAVGYQVNRTARTACYNCIVNAKATYELNDIINGKELQKVGGGNWNTTDGVYKKIRHAYLTALARSRYDLYKISGYFNASN